MIAQKGRPFTVKKVPGALSPEHAQQVVDELLSLDEQTASAVVEKAKSKSSALHPIIFAMSNADAAWAFRLIQARDLLAGIEVVYLDEEKPEPRRLFVNVQTPPNEEREYRDLAVVTSKRDTIRNVVDYRIKMVKAHYEYVVALNHPASTRRFVKECCKMFGCS